MKLTFTRQTAVALTSIGLALAAALAGCASTGATNPVGASLPTPSPSREAASVRCAQDTAFCFPGDAGPGGGTIFSVIPGNGQATILEVAEQYWYTDCDTCLGTANADGSITWDEAEEVIAAYSNNVSNGGTGDWRMPTMPELRLLYDFPGRNAIGGFAPTWYWSSDASENTGSVEILNFGSGSSGTNPKSDRYMVRPVRTAQSPFS